MDGAQLLNLVELLIRHCLCHAMFHVVYFKYILLLKWQNKHRATVIAL